ncbi:uncharacterized protein LOC121705111 [Alosa sapidissima]|uniref:uncharacterized protein LOC121705111 n=1 Tax=Alosa sapidissima TaxID=34773 RepID=UPI001C08D7BA|nr:uncharacterized protein LOC121705111 [Alosa sapidissima]XP_041941821.1 uncharacterized protein LOC121705111 [Alosa sapidissima]XP_041941822.1 uncharacterized protein LOC121705111 [Alosa sapidissima]
MAQSLPGQSFPEDPAEKDCFISGLQEEFIFLSEYLKGLKNEEWLTFHEIMVNPVTKAEFFTLLIDLVKYVDLTSVKVVIPALLKMVRELANQDTQDPTIQDPTKTPSATYAEDDSGIKLFNNGVLVEIIPRTKSSRASTASSCSKTSTDSRKRKTTTEQLVENVSQTLSEFLRVQDQSMECFLDDQKRNISAKKCLACIKKAVNVLTCHYSCINDFPPPQQQVAEDEIEVKEVSSGSQRSELCVKVVSSEEFHTKAKKAVKDVFIGNMKQFQSSPRTPSSDSLGVGIETSSLCPQHVEEAAAVLIETFVEEMKKVALLAEYADEPMSPDEGKILDQTQRVPPHVSGLKTKKVQVAAKQIYGKLKVTLKDFFRHFPLQHSPAALRTEEPNEFVSLALDVHTAEVKQKNQRPTNIKTDQALPVAKPQSPVARKVQSDIGCPLSPSQLDDCTRNVLKGVLASYFSGLKQNPIQEGLASPDLLADKSSFFDGVIVQLKNMACSTSAGCNESDDSELTKNDVTGVLRKPCSFTSIKRLSDVEFQMNAFEAVTNVLVGSVRSYTSLQSYTTDIYNDELQGMPWKDFTSRDMDALVTDIVDQFVSDIQMSTLLSASPDQVGTRSFETKLATLKNKLATSNNQFIISASNMYENLLTKVGKFFAQCSSLCNIPGKQADDEPVMDGPCLSSLETTQSIDDTLLANPLIHKKDIKDMVDLDGCTREIMSELFMVLNEENAKEDAANISEKLSTISLADKVVDSVIPNLTDEKDSDQSAHKDCNDSPDSLSKLIEEVFGEEGAQTNAIKSVNEVLLQSTTNLSRLTTSSLTEQTACEMVSTIVEGIQSILDNTCSDIKGDIEGGLLSSQGNERMGNDLKVTIWTTTCGMFKTLWQKVLDLFTMNQRLCSKTSGDPYVYAKEAIRKALISIKESLLKSNDLKTRDDLQIINLIINSMLEHIGKAEGRGGLEQIPTKAERPVSTSSKWPEGSANPTSGNVHGVVSETEITTEGTIERETSTDVDNAHACITRQAVTSVVKMVNEKINSENGGCSSSEMQDGGLHTVAKKLSRSRSQETINYFTHDFVDQVCGLFLSSNRVAAHKFASDSVLLEMGHCSTSRRHNVSQLVEIYAKETVKHYLLPHFNLPFSWGINQGGSSWPASAPVCLPSSLSGTALNEQTAPMGSRSPSKILCDIVNLVIKTMVSDVMNSLSLPIESGKNKDQLGHSLKPCWENLLSTESSAALPQELGFHRDEDVIPFPFPKIMPVDSDNYAGLVTLLVVRLLMQTKGQGLQSEALLERSRQLVDKILYVFDIVSGSSRNDPFPLNIRVHRVFRIVYGDLLREFGTEEIFLKAMVREDPTFEKTLVSSLTKQLLQICKEAEEDLPPQSTGQESARPGFSLFKRLSVIMRKKSRVSPV